MSEIQQQEVLAPALVNFARTSMYNLFSQQEMSDIMAAAAERKRSLHGLVHDAVMDALATSATWGNARP